jgi:hypothetical protein
MVYCIRVLVQVLYYNLNKVMASLLLSGQVESSKQRPCLRKQRDFAEVVQALYGMLMVAMLWNKHFRGDLEEIGLVFNSCNPCVAHQTLSKLQQTVHFFVDDLISSYQMADVNDAICVISAQFVDSAHDSLIASTDIRSLVVSYVTPKLTTHQNSTDNHQDNKVPFCHLHKILRIQLQLRSTLELRNPGSTT